MANHDAAVTEGGFVSGGTGFVCGGLISVAQTIIQKLDYATETTSTSGSSLLTAQRDAGVSSSASTGLLAGGTNATPSFVQNGQSLTFSTEVMAQRFTTLSVARTSTAGVGSATHSYISGGETSSIFVDTITKVDYSTRVGTDLAATLASARRQHGGVYTATHGYYLGGVSSAEIDGIVFATDAANNPAAALTVAGAVRNSGTHSATRGYVTGFNVTVFDIYGVQFSDETAINPSTALSVSRGNSAGVFSAENGYWCGGSAGSVSSAIDGIRFADETAIDPAAALGTALQGASGMSYVLATPSAGTSQNAALGVSLAESSSSAAAPDATLSTPLSDSHTASATATETSGGSRGQTDGAAESAVGGSAQGSAFLHSSAAAEPTAAVDAVSASVVVIVDRSEIVVANTETSATAVVRVSRLEACTAVDMESAIASFFCPVTETAVADGQAGTSQTFVLHGDAFALANVTSGASAWMDVLIAEAAAAVAAQLVREPAVDTYADTIFVTVRRETGARIVCFKRA